MLGGFLLISVYQTIILIINFSSLILSELRSFFIGNTFNYILFSPQG